MKRVTGEHHPKLHRDCSSFLYSIFTTKKKQPFLLRNPLMHRQGGRMVPAVAACLVLAITLLPETYAATVARNPNILAPSDSYNGSTISNSNGESVNSDRFYYNSSALAEKHRVSAKQSFPSGESDHHEKQTVYINLIGGHRTEKSVFNTSTDAPDSDTSDTITNITITDVTTPQGGYRPKFTMEELLEKRFERRISNDIYLDPCKGGKCVKEVM